MKKHASGGLLRAFAGKKTKGTGKDEAKPAFSASAGKRFFPAPFPGGEKEELSTELFYLCSRNPNL